MFNNSIASGRSVCLHCGHKLAWYDLIPVFSWAVLKGKCRSCGVAIGWLEPLLEVSLAVFFVISYLFWPHTLDDFFSIAGFVIWLLSGILLAVLFIYDLKWSLLPDKINYIFALVAFVGAILIVIDSGAPLASALNIVGSVLVLSGLYYLLHTLSKGRLVGFGDVKLGLGLGLLLADWRLGIVALFTANLLGCLVVAPGLITGKLKRTSRVPFGPFLILGTLIAGLFGHLIIDFYFSLTSI